MRPAALALAVVFAAAQAAAQGVEERSLEIEGETLRYTLRTHPADAHRFDPAARTSPGNALDTAKLLNQHLTAGRLEDAALLSNAPKRRYAVLQDYQQEVGEEEFRRVFAQYFYPENRIAAEIAIGAHTLLIWHLAQTDRYAGLFFMEIEGRTLMDDVPSETRSQLRRLLEAYRSGALGAAPVEALPR
jgi:hypothetical protein